MPSVSARQHRAMESAAHGHSTLGIPKAVGQEFVAADAASRGDCAGILFRARGPLYLLLRRTDTGEWAQPGGHLEGDEAPEEAAYRECVEEIGTCPDGLRWAVRRNAIPKGRGIFTCYLQDVPEPFEPDLNEEHDNWGWFAPDALPSPMHRKVAETIERITGNELDIASRMAKSELLSPQHYENVWLFDIRITGTGTSYRSSLDEYVYRPPEDFLTEEFVQRCNGLPLVFEHPDKNILNTGEFRDRSIGTMFLPYIKGDEVWGIAKVFDDDAAQLMCASHASTSPAVVFRDAGSTETVQLDDGSTVLIEGRPSYLDHLAICEEGVWDKGGDPSGVNANGETAMADEIEEKAPAWADAIMKRCDELHARLDAMDNKGEVEDREDSFDGLEKKVEGEGYDKEAAEKIAGKVAQEKKAERKDSEKEAERDGEKEEREERDADRDLKKAEKDGEEERRAEERKDEERADAQSRENRELRAQIAAMDRRIQSFTAPQSASDRDALSLAQSRADNVAYMFGDSVSPPLHGESPIAYRKRLAAKLQKHSVSAKDIKLDSLDAHAFGVIEERIYADAQLAARNPAKVPTGKLIAHTRADAAGRQITEFSGDPMACWAPFMAPGVGIRINRNHKGA